MWKSLNLVYENNNWIIKYTFCILSSIFKHFENDRVLYLIFEIWLHIIIIHRVFAKNSKSTKQGFYYMVYSINFNWTWIVYKPTTNYQLLGHSTYDERVEKN